MAEILDARVKQKTGTAAEFAGYNLLEGEIALVRTSANGPVFNFKVGPGNFDSLDWSLQNPGAAVAADTSTVFPAGVPGLYIPTEDGNYDGVTVDLSEGVNYLIWDGTDLTKIVYPIDLSGYATIGDIDGQIQQGETRAPNGDTVYNFAQPVQRALEYSAEIIKTNMILASNLTVAGLNNGILFLAKNNGNGYFRVQRPSIQGNRFRIGYFTDDPVRVGSQFTYIYNDVATGDTSLEYAGTVPDGATYLAVYLNNTPADVNDFDLNIFLYGHVMKEEKYVQEEFIYGINLFNKNDNTLTDKDVVGGVITDFAGRILSNAMPVKAGMPYTVSGKTLTNAADRTLHFFAHPSDNQSVQSFNVTTQTFVSPINGWLRTVSKGLSFDWRETLQVNEGSQALPYTPYTDPISKISIKPEYLPYSADGGILKTVRLETEYGSLDAAGFYPVPPTNYTDFKAWKVTEFRKNLRSKKYLNVTGGTPYKISLDVEDYSVTVFQYDSNFSLLKTDVLDSDTFSTLVSAKLIKLHASKTDGTDLGILPSVMINGLFGDKLYTYNDRKSNDIITFVAQVQNVKNGRDMIDPNHFSEPYQFDTEIHCTHGIIRLPVNYSADGDPIRLICFAHGSSDWRVMNFGSYDAYIQYLVDEGYAVWDAFAWSSKWPDASQYMCSPTNNSCYNSVYNYIVNNFNVRDDGIHLFGKSHGGNQVLALPYCTSIPILSAVALAGAGLTLNYNLGYSNTQDREATARDFGIEGDISVLLDTPDNSPEAQAFLKSNIDKFIGMVPMFCGVINLTPEDMVVNHWNDLNAMDYSVWSKVPTKSYISQSDNLWLLRVAQNRQRWVRKGGGVFELRYMPYTDNVNDAHHTVDTFGPFVSSITTRLGFVHQNVPVAYAEMLQFFRRYE